MSSTFTPSNVVDMSKERDWSASLGLLDWDNTNIVFTKRSLIEFLKYTGTTVDTNFSNINKLPRYAKFGTITNTTNEPETVNENNATSSQTDEFIPTRRVRTVPGGPHTDIFAEGDEGDALAQAPPIPRATQKLAQATLPEEATDSATGLPPSGIKPTRRVRENPGGNSSLSNFWDAEETAEFKPTRRVREGPGGRDSISQIL